MMHNDGEYIILHLINNIFSFYVYRSVLFITYENAEKKIESIILDYCTYTYLLKFTLFFFLHVCVVCKSRSESRSFRPFCIKQAFVWIIRLLNFFYLIFFFYHTIRNPESRFSCLALYMVGPSYIYNNIHRGYAFQVYLLNMPICRVFVYTECGKKISQNFIFTILKVIFNEILKVISLCSLYIIYTFAGISCSKYKPTNDFL